MAQDAATTPQSAPPAAQSQTIAPPDLSGLVTPKTTSQSAPAETSPSTTSTASTPDAASSPVAPKTAADTTADSNASDVPVNPQALAQAAAEDAAKAKAARQQAAERKAATAAPAKAERANSTDAAPAIPEAQPQVAQQQPAPVPPTMAQQPETPATATPVASQSQATEQSARPDNSTLLWIGLAGLAIVIAGVTAAMMLRRSRPADSVEETYDEAYVGDAPEAEIAPTVVEEPIVEEPAVERPSYIRPEPVATPAVAMTSDSDVGRHEQAALRGPTSDNPFLTLRKRLARARFYDRQERLAAEAAGRPADMPWAAREQATEREPEPQQVRRTARTGGNPLNWSNGGMKPAFDS